MGVFTITMQIGRITETWKDRYFGLWSGWKGRGGGGVGIFQHDLRNESTFTIFLLT